MALGIVLSNLDVKTSGCQKILHLKMYNPVDFVNSIDIGEQASNDERRLTAAVLVAEIGKAPNLLPRREGRQEEEKKGRKGQVDAGILFGSRFPGQNSLSHTNQSKHCMKRSNVCDPAGIFLTVYAFLDCFRLERKNKRTGRETLFRVPDEK